MLGAGRARTLKGPIQRGESNDREGSGVCSVSSSTSPPHSELDVPPMSVQLRFVLVLTSLQQRAYLGRLPAHQVRGGLA